MAIILNPRGTSGSGKTELARRIMAAYGPTIDRRTGPAPRRGGPRLLACRLRHPHGGRPLAVLGPYAGTAGGCDRIRLVDGGMDAVFGMAAAHAGDGCDVLLEGLRLSSEQERSAALAAAYPLHVLWLDTPLERCVRNLIGRRRAGRAAWSAIARSAAAEQAGVEAACAGLQACARIEIADFDTALRRARALLGLDARRAAA